jgi:hypothetical protein
VRALILCLLLASTSLAIYGFARAVLGYRRPKMSTVAASALECLGLTALFFVANTLVGVLAVLAVRLTTPVFLSVYTFSDLTLIPLSLVQALLFAAWRQQEIPQ